MFEKFTKTCLEYYKLDPCHYFTNPGLSWDLMIRASKVELDLISDTDRHLFIEKGMRVGLSYIAKRHSSINRRIEYYLLGFKQFIWLEYESTITIW